MFRHLNDVSIAADHLGDFTRHVVAFALLLGFHEIHAPARPPRRKARCRAAPGALTSQSFLILHESHGESHGESPAVARLGLGAGAVRGRTGLLVEALAVEVCSRRHWRAINNFSWAHGFLEEVEHRHDLTRQTAKPHADIGSPKNDVCPSLCSFYDFGGCDFRGL